MARLALVAIAFLLVPLAGCSDDADNKDPLASIATPESAEEVQVTDTTGAIRGVVIDEKIVPLPGVTIVITGQEGAVTTAQDGGFVVNGLEAGDYFLSASKAGYTTIQTSASVVAGVDDPPLVKIILSLDVANTPFVEIQNWKAFLQCGVGFVTSVNPCLFTGSDNVHYFQFNDGVSAGQGEAVWTGTQPLGNTLWFEVGGDVAEGESPLVVRLDGETLEDRANDEDSIMVRVFAGDDNPTVVINQGYDVYVSYFYNFVPREDYVFALDGPCDPISVCQ